MRRVPTFRRAGLDFGRDMGHADFEGGEERGGWGSGLLWPAARFVAILALAAAAVHWILGAGATAPHQAQIADQTLSPPAEPAETDDSGSGEVTVRADRNGHFMVKAVIDGEDMDLLVDTGASSLVLSSADAARLGIDTHRLSYTERYQTANGIALGAPVTLREFRVNSFSLHDVRATVMVSPMPVSLLGMSVLSRFAEHEMRGDKLILRW